MFKKVLTALAVSTPLLWQPGVMAQAAWPTKPVNVIVSSGAGSGTDIAARMVMDTLSKAYGQPFIIQNKAGANGIVGTEAAAKAPNDGYTLFFTYAGAHVVSQALYDKVPFDVLKDFAAIAQVGSGGNLLIVSPDVPVKDLNGFIAYVKSKPAGSVSYGSWGIGSGGHISMEALSQKADLKMQHIPYKSSAEVTNAMVSGQVAVAFGSIAPSMPFIQSGKFKAVAVSGPNRVPQLPEVRTMTEQGIPFDQAAWYGIFAPAGTPSVVVNSVNKEITKMLNTPETLDKLKKTFGLADFPIKTPEQFAETVRNDLRGWGAIIKAGNIRAE